MSYSTQSCNNLNGCLAALYISKSLALVLDIVCSLPAMAPKELVFLSGHRAQNVATGAKPSKE